MCQDMLRFLHEQAERRLQAARQATAAATEENRRQAEALVRQLLDTAHQQGAEDQYELFRAQFEEHVRRRGNRPLLPKE